MGLAIIEYPVYINRVFEDHLNNNTTYHQFTKERAESYKKNIVHLLSIWITKNIKVLNKIETKYLRYHIRTNTTPFPVFYLTMKLHKTP